MKIAIKVKPNAKQSKIEKTGEGEFSVWIREPAKEGRANISVIEVLSEYFDVAKTRISIVRGHQSKNKIVSID